MSRRLFAATFLAALSFSASAHADINSAFVGPMTGGAANYGLMTVVGVQQAVDDINQSGGINGQTVALRNYDDACDPKQAVAVANRIIAENIHYVIQGDCSGSSIAAEKVYIEENILLVNPLASNPQFTDQGGPMVFRTLYRDDQAVSVLAPIIIKKFGSQKLAIIHDKGAYGYGLADGIRKALNKAGMKEVFFDSYDPASRDFSALITRLKKAEIKVLFVGGWPVDIATLARQIRESGLNIQIVAGDLSDQDYWKVAKEAGEGSLFIFPPDPLKNKQTKDLQKKFDAKHQIYNGLTVYGYASALMLAQAIRQTGDMDPIKVAAFMHQKDFDTVLGKWHFDQKGDVQNFPLILNRWHNGKYEEVGQ